MEVLGIGKTRERRERNRKREKMRFNAGFAEPSSVIGPDQREEGEQDSRDSNHQHPEKRFKYRNESIRR